MNGKKQCEMCVYGIVRCSEPDCTNKYVNRLKDRPDPYDCEFFDEISGSYAHDMERVMDNSDLYD